MASSDILLRVQELGGSWLPIGTEKSRGIWLDPTSFSLSADLWGTQQLQATVRYNPRVIQPHLSAFTPWECEIGGVLAGSGRISQTPSNDGDDRSITIIGEGWQYHLDDDVYQRVYAHTNLTDWQDIHNDLSADLTKNVSAIAASSDAQGCPTLTWGNGLPRAAGTGGGVFLDLGQDSTAQRVVVSWSHSNNSSGSTLIFVAASTTAALSAWTGASNVVVMNTTPVGSASFTVSPTARYVGFFMVDNTGTALTPIVDTWIKLTSLQVFASTSYESGGSSILVGSAIAKDAVARATVLLSPDMSQVAPTGFVIPEFAMSADTTPRDAITNATSFDDVIPRITVDRQLSIRPRPQLPLYEVGEWSGAQFQDASTNSGDGIFSGVSVSGTDATGAPIKVRRNQVPTFFSPSAIQPSNPSATANTTGWVATAGTLTRDTTTFDTTPGAFKLTNTARTSVAMSTGSWAGGTFVPGQTYSLSFRVAATASAFNGAASVVDANGSVIGASALFFPGPTFQTVIITFAPQTNGTPTFAIAGDMQLAGSVWIDTLSLSQGAATLADRRGFRRTYALGTNMSLTGASAAALGDVFLASHRTTPFKGTLTLAGPGSVRRVRGGQSITPAELLRNTGELILFSYLTDPDTGGLGRYGRIASVALAGPWNATVQIDSTNDNFQDLLNRIQVNTAQVR